MPLAASENATKAMKVSTMTDAWPSTPAAAGAATTSTFFIHCFGRAVRISPERRDADGGGAGLGSAPDVVGTGSAIRRAYPSPAIGTIRRIGGLDAGAPTRLPPTRTRPVP